MQRAAAFERQRAFYSHRDEMGRILVMDVLGGKGFREYEAVIDGSRVWSLVLAIWILRSRIGDCGG